MLLVTLDNLKLFLEKEDTDHDDLLTDIITKVSARVELFMNRSLESKERTLYFDAGRKIYSLPAYPISSVVVTVDDEVQDVDDDYYIWSEEGLIEFYVEPIYCNPRQVKIVWTGGYSVGEIPEEVQMAVQAQCAFLFKRRKDIGVNSTTIPDGTVNVNAPFDLLPDVKNILRSFRRRPSVK